MRSVAFSLILEVPNSDPYVYRNVHTSPSVKHASAASTPGIASHHGDVQTDSFFSPVPAAGQLASVQAPVGSLASPSIARKVDVSTPGLVDGMQSSGGAGGATAATASTFVPSYGVGADGMSMSMISHDGQIRGAEQGGEKTIFPTDTRVVRFPSYFSLHWCLIVAHLPARPPPLFSATSAHGQPSPITPSAAQFLPSRRPLHFPTRSHRSKTLHGVRGRHITGRTACVSFFARAYTRGDTAGQKPKGVWSRDGCVSGEVSAGWSFVLSAEGRG